MGLGSTTDESQGLVQAEDSREHDWSVGHDEHEHRKRNQNQVDRLASYPDSKSET